MSGRGRNKNKLLAKRNNLPDTLDIPAEMGYNDCFAQKPGKYENVHYHIIDDLNKLETVRFGDLSCTSLNQTINDMLDEYYTMDEQALVEGLADYFCSHGRTFEGISVKSDTLNALRQ